MQSDRASRVISLRVIPRSCMITNVPKTITGSPATVTSVFRMSRKKNMTTSAARIAPRISDSWTSLSISCTNVEVSYEGTIRSSG